MTGLSCCKKANETVDTCHDGVRNQIETGIDCGGPCAPCVSCTDGIKNGDETGIDCGGHCSACPTCFDGLKNQGETGIDCGGPCAECAGCSDGIKNGNETNIDCGGSCQPCATCADGIRNNGETGIDCGGPCSPCPPPFNPYFFTDSVVGNYLVSGTHNVWQMGYGGTIDTLTNVIISIQKYDSVSVVYDSKVFIYSPSLSVSTYCFTWWGRMDFTKTDIDAISISTHYGGMGGGDDYYLHGRKIH